MSILNETETAGTEETSQVCYQNTVRADGTCGDCWHSLAANKVCETLFFIFCSVFVIVVILIILYSKYRKKAHA